MPVAPAGHLGDQRLMAPVERRQPPLPPTGLGVETVAPLSLREDVPEAVQLAVLSEQVCPTQLLGGNVPDSHRFAAGWCRSSRDVESEAIEASFEDGILNVVIPKSERARRRRIDVRTGAGSQRVEADGR